MLKLSDIDHEGCGHSQVLHGHHFDSLIPRNDGSYFNARDVIVQALVNSSRLLQFDEAADPNERDKFKIVNRQLNENCILMPCASMERNVVHGGMTKVDIPANLVAALCKTKLDAMAICCPSEVPWIKKLLDPLPGVKDISVNVTVKTVLVLHDQQSITGVELVKVLNGAHLDASIHQRGELEARRSWPSPWCLGSGILVAVSFSQHLYSPMRWVALGAVAFGLVPLTLKAISALRKFVLDINMLMLLIVIGAIVLGEYLEAGATAFLFLLAEWLRSRSTDKAHSAIAAVLDRVPQMATLSDGGERVRVEDVQVGTFLSVKAGETVPIDGEVVSGRSSMDESILICESVPVKKELRATVWAGTMNVSECVTMKTTALSVDSAVARMVSHVEESQDQGSKTELLLEKVAKYYTPAVEIAGIVAGAVLWASGVHNRDHWVYLLLILLVAASPAALFISSLVVVTCGIAQAARLGLLVKDGTHLKILGSRKVVALNKTGILSDGQFRVSDVLSIDGNSKSLQKVLYWVTSVENKASHPLAAALVSYARLKGVEPSEDVTDFKVIVGEGVSAVVDGHAVQIGNTRMAGRFGWNAAAAVEKLANRSSCGGTVGWIGLDGTAIGIFSAGDHLRPEAAEAVRELKALGIRVAMLTGDSKAAAAHVREKVFAELLPEDKIRIVKVLKEDGVTAMVGDGINDEPELAAADVGIVMGAAGSAVAMEKADVALMTNDPRKLAAAVRLGLNCRWKFWQNITFSFVTKLLVIIGLAAGGYAYLWAAVVADVGTCLAVIFNSMRLLKKAKHHVGQDQCISQKLASDKELKELKGISSSCEEGGTDIERCETLAFARAGVQAPEIPHTLRARTPWQHEYN